MLIKEHYCKLLRDNVFDMAFPDALFPYSDKIMKALPTLFNMVELENRRGKKLGMEVGTARERVLIALFMYVYEQDSVEFPPSTSHELDVIVKGHPISIKTRSGKVLSGVKLIWTVDQEKVINFINVFLPKSHLIYVNIIWDSVGGFFFIPLKVQKEVLQDLGKEKFMKVPSQGTNPRGVEISSHAMHAMQQHSDTLCLSINWKRDPSLLVERALYRRWIDLWDTLS